MMRLTDVDVAVCGRCGGKLKVRIEPDGSTHYARAVCSSCRRFVDWIKKPREDNGADKDFYGSAEWFERNVDVIGETPKSFHVRAEDGSEHWVPRSQIRGDGVKDGSIIVSAWWAHKAKWDRNDAR